MAHIPGLYLKPESFSPSYGRKKMTDTLKVESWNVEGWALKVEGWKVEG